MELKPWIDAAAVGGISLLGFLAGRRCSTLQSGWWMMGYIAPLIVLCLVALGRNILTLEFRPPFSWVLVGRAELVLGGACAACVLATLLSRLRTQREQRALTAFLAVFVLIGCVWPFLAPAFTRTFWKNSLTAIDTNGICRQATDYSCGPAAAVTALRRLGIAAEEADLAILAHSSNASGTPADLLSEAIQKRYSANNIHSLHRPYGGLAELRSGSNVITLAVIKYGFLVDHYVTVLETTPTNIVVGDPLMGLQTYLPEEFLKVWRRTGIELRRGG